MCMCVYARVYAVSAPCTMLSCAFLAPLFANALKNNLFAIK